MPGPSMEDPDVRLVLALYGPNAKETRSHLDPSFLARMDAEVAALLGGGSATVPSIEGLFRALGKMSDERAEETTRQIADIIEKHLKGERERLQGRLREATEAQQRLGQEIAGINEAERALECEPVLEGFGCPRCGERREDWLLVQEDESVKCGTCGLVYRLPGDAKVVGE